MADLNELRQQRAALVAQARAIHEEAKAAKRNITAEEENRFNTLMEESNKVKSQIDREELLSKEETELKASQGTVAAKKTGEEGESDDPRASKEYRTAFNRFLRNGATPEIRAALQAGSVDEGGTLITPQQFVARIIKAVDNAVVIRSLATNYPLPKAESLGIPTLTSDVDDAAWTSELATGAEDTALRFGKREFKPHPLAKRIKVSNTLIRVSTVDIEAFIADRLGYKFAVTLERAYMTGSGAQQPLGLFVNSNDGIPAARDVSTGNTNTAFTCDGLINAKFSVKPQYWPNARWLFHRDAVKMLALIKDGEGQYIWSQSVRDGEPDRVLGKPVLMSEYVPNTFANGLYVGMFADFSHYWTAEALDLRIQRLVELYAETNQTGFIGRLEADGAPVLSEAFARVTLAP